MRYFLITLLWFVFITPNAFAQVFTYEGSAAGSGVVAPGVELAVWICPCVCVMKHSKDNVNKDLPGGRAVTADDCSTEHDGKGCRAGNDTDGWLFGKIGNFYRD